MILLPLHLYKQYRAFCANRRADDALFADYVKWLRFFLDFCEKYHVAGEEADRISRFLNKMLQKGQSEERLQQARQAVEGYFEMIRSGVGGQQLIRHAPDIRKQSHDPKSSGANLLAHGEAQSYYVVSRYQETSDSPEWDEVIGKLADEIKVRHYSRKALKTYALWSRQFQRFLKNKPPAELSTDDVKEYLTYLAVK